MALAGAFFFGFVPMFLMAAFVNWLDRYEKEPKLLLGAAFMWGMVIAGGGAFILNTAFGIGLFMFTGSESLAEFGTTSISAPIVEEGLKGLAVLIVFLMFRKEFDSILDGIVYGAITAMGFAAIQKIANALSLGNDATTAVRFGAAVKASLDSSETRFFEFRQQYNNSLDGPPLVLPAPVANSP